MSHVRQSGATRRQPRPTALSTPAWPRVRVSSAGGNAGHTSCPQPDRTGRVCIFVSPCGLRRPCPSSSASESISAAWRLGLSVHLLRRPPAAPSSGCVAEIRRRMLSVGPESTVRKHLGPHVRRPPLPPPPPPPPPKKEKKNSSPPKKEKKKEKIPPPPPPFHPPPHPFPPPPPAPRPLPPAPPPPRPPPPTPPPFFCFHTSFWPASIN